MTRRFTVAVVAGLLIAFAAGFLVANGLHPSASPSPSQAWSLFGRPRPADAARRGVPKPAGFTVWMTRLDTSGPQPLACVRMTRALDPALAYGDYVLVSPQPDHPPAVSVRGDELCLGGMGFTDRQITLLKGLRARSGEQLAANTDVAFSSSEKPPYVGFAGSGVILPREDSDGVGIETVNVKRLAIEVWRVPDRNLVRRTIAVAEPGDYDSYDSSPDEEGRVVWKGLVTVAGDAGARTTTVFPLGAVLKEMRPGGYVIKARDASAAIPKPDKNLSDDDDAAHAQRWILFTDMALTGYTGADSLDVMVRSLKTAKPMGGLAVALVAKDGETLANTRSDASGRASFAHALLAGEGASTPRMVMAYGANGDLAVLDLDRSPVDLSKQSVGGRRAPGAATTDAISGRALASVIDGYLYTDRGIYRPGERVHMTAMVRGRDARIVEDRRGYLLVKRPSGVEFKRFVFTNAAGGAVLADVDLPRSAPRGRWTVELRIDGLDEPAGSASFAVEDFAPQRLAVTAEDPRKTPVLVGETRPIDVVARFLYGAIGSGLKTQGEARVRVDPDPFPNYPDYRWGDEVKPFEEKFVELASTVTDGAGRAVLAFPETSVGDTADPLVAAVNASVFEPGGRPVRQGVSLAVRPRPVYLGVKVEPSGPESDRAPIVSLDAIAVDAAGRRIAAPGVAYVLIGESWRYDWFQQNGRWQWRRSSHDTVIDKGVLAIGAGAPARISRRLGWGDYRLELTGPGGAHTVRRFSAGWGAPSKDIEAPDLVRVSAGVKAHVQGDSIDVAIKGPYAGEAQVAVATDRIIDFKTLTVGAAGAVVHLKTSAAWGGGAYVMVTIIQPRDPVATPLPRRALGILYVPLDPKTRRLSVAIGTPVKLDSRTPVTVPIQVGGLGVGERAYVTVAAVDEGILALTKFESPDPVKWYFGKRALTVDYRDDYGRLLDANLGAPANVAFGGDELSGEGLTTTPIKTVALWSGVVKTGLDGRALVHLPAGDFNGQLRIMAVAWTAKAVGSGAKAMTVRQPVVADLDLPRFLSPGDEPVATLELHNVEGAAGDYFARVFASDGLWTPFRDLVHLLAGQRVVRSVPFAAPSRTGVSHVTLAVTGPAFSTTKGYDIETRLGWGPITRVTTELQAPGAAYTPPSSLLAGLAAGDVELQVGYSPFRGFDPSTIALALSRYPYGCTEQLVSTAFPRLYAREMSADPRLAAGLADAVGKILDRQSLDGAFGLWRVGDGEASPWLGAYVTDFLLQARAKGAPVPQEAIDRALGAMREVSRPAGFLSASYKLSYPDDWLSTPAESKAATERMRSRASAYALYDLAKSGHGDLPRLRWWHDVQMKTEHSPLAMAQIGAGLAMMGDQARAHSALRQAVSGLGYRDWSDPYQSPLRDLAGVIALAFEAGEPDVGRALESRLAGTVRDPDALNTQEQATLLQAAHAMLRTAGAFHIEATNASPLVALGGAPRWAVGRLASARFVNRGTGALWRTVTVRGTPLGAPGTTADGLTLTKRFYSLSGAEISAANLRQGERVIVLLSGVSRQGRTVALAVDDPLPAGWEIESTLTAADAQNGPYKFLGKLTEPGVQESRDDRYMAAMSLAGGKPFAFAYLARAITPGTYFLPGANAFDMYHRGVSARTAAGRLKITPAG